METDDRKELEQFNERYLDALERRDPKALGALWKQSERDRCISVYGVTDGFEKISRLLEKVLVEDLSLLHLVSGEMEILSLNENDALVYAAYEIVKAGMSQTNAESERVFETRYMVKDEQGWKLSCLHQSMPNAAIEKKDHDSQALIIDEMLDLVGAGPEGKRKSFRERKVLLENLLSNLKEEQITPRLIELEASLLGMERENLALTALPFIMDEKQNLSVWTGEPARLAVDGLISFMKTGQSYDPWLSKRAGLGLQRDNYYHRHIRKEKTWVNPNYELPVKGIIEVCLDPVFGLYTPPKRKAFENALKEALEKAKQAGYRSVAVLPGWRDVLNVPLAEGALSLAGALEQAIEESGSPIKKAVLISARSDQTKALRASAEKAQMAESGVGEIAETPQDKEQDGPERSA